MDADAYLAWWTLAGVDTAIAETPANWLRPVPSPASSPASAPPAASQSLPPPQSFDAFRIWLAQDQGQPERRWAGPLILPQGPVQAPLMIVTDMPDPADINAGNLFAERSGQLFDAILRAIGAKRSDIHLASLFLSRPPGGMVEASDLIAAATRMRTHVMLAAPQRLLLLGDRTIRALTPVAEESSEFFNHDGGTLAVFATFHPRLLLGQPAAKAECWRVLQSLIEDMRK